MSFEITEEKLALFQSLFKAKEDAFAVRWEKDGRSGYMPSYQMDWEAYKTHKKKGGTFSNFKDKTLLPLTTKEFVKHLAGEQVTGIYPLLDNNTSWFVAVDFDEQGWDDECRKFLTQCKQHKIPASLERSRSGNGGHVWIFFTNPYAAYKSRKIVKYLLELAGVISIFDKKPSFDRIFPNQDYHSGMGLGNLIALPLQQQAVEKGNSCFIDPVNLVPFENQWEFLGTISKIATESLEIIYNQLFNNTIQQSDSSVNIVSERDHLDIGLSNIISLSRSQLSTQLIRFLRDNLNFINTDYLIKKKMGKPIYGTEAYFKILEERGDSIIIPRGFIGQLLRYCIQESIPYELKDNRRKYADVKISSKIILYDYQEAAVEITAKKDFGIIVAPPGTGKTVIALSIIANKKQPALIIVHRKQLFDQWMERIQVFMGIPRHLIGKIVSGEKKEGLLITVAMMQSLEVISENDPIFQAYGTIIIDECHHIPAKTFRDTIKRFNSFYLYGLTATPFRKNRDEQLIFSFIGDVIHEIKSNSYEKGIHNNLSIKIRDTELYVPFDYKTDKFESLSQILIHDSTRNNLIVNDIKKEVRAGRRGLILTERKSHIDTLCQFLKQQFEIIALSGDDSEQLRKSKMKQITSGEFQILIATGQFIGEGIDIDNLDCLFLAFPFAFEGKLIQYIGRVQRSSTSPIIYDYRDIKIEYLEKLFKQRNKYYRKLQKAGQLQQHDELLLLFDGDKVYLDQKNNALPISILDLPFEIKQFKKDVAWRIRILNYNEVDEVIFAEILNYQAEQNPLTEMQLSLDLLGIEKIKFRSISSDHLLRSVQLKPTMVQGHSKKMEFPDKEDMGKSISKLLKLPFNKIKFGNGFVSFSYFIEELNKSLDFEIENNDIRPEFEVLKDYFIKVLKKKTFAITVWIKFDKSGFTSTAATSDDIDKINSNIVESVRFEFVRKGILTTHGALSNNKFMATMEELMAINNKPVTSFFKSDKDLLNDILNVKKSKHYLQLKYLSTQHEASILKIRFILQPLSFIFLIMGNEKYHLVWETLDSHEATYIWHVSKTKEALRQAIGMIEGILQEIRNTGKQEYLKKDHPDFSRIFHDYSDPKKGFVLWKGQLEERII
ncbi:DEAD/DEAH box helicase [Chitinophaga sp. sic0106]|uniref:DEAD/DEAH box helicase n=1 Tax=Chitinophaga sp. sic0106 TaxID=2854785 RepID=UPI001C48296B|nr:DEAD/DEAH box helicase [Chitinophaga sp. sic0106]MBV7533785.1 DEAD/DEAH box helicase [Chitinophaga sp. sic0106]